MTYYGEGPLNLVVENRTSRDYASVSFCARQKKNNTCVFIVKEIVRLFYIYVT